MLGIVLGSGGASVPVRHLDCGLRGSQGRDDMCESVPETRAEQRVVGIWKDRIWSLPEELFFASEKKCFSLVLNNFISQCFLPVFFVFCII